MSEDDLIAYLLAARIAGDKDASGTAVGILVYRLTPLVQKRIRLKVPESDVEDLAQSVLLSALTSDFDSSTIGQFRSWVSTIIKRRIADYHRDPKRKTKLMPLPEENQGDEGAWRDGISAPGQGDVTDVHRALATAYGELTNESHRQAIDLYVFGGHPASEVAAQADLSVDNIHQIAKRFRDRVKELLGADDDTSG